MSTLTPRGPLSALAARLLREPTPVSVVEEQLGDGSALDVWSADFQLALWAVYETQYDGAALAGVSESIRESAQWDPAVVACARALGQVFEEALRSSYSALVPVLPDPCEDPGSALLAFVDEVDERLGADVLGGGSISRHVQRHATREQVLEVLVERSLFGLKESDPHAFVLPRLRGAAKAALAELLYDEFGGGRADRVHAGLYARAMTAAGLDATPGAYLDAVSAGSFAVNNAMSLLCLNVRTAPAAAGHFAAFEATSAVPSRRLAAGVERVGLPEESAAYFHEHVLADSVHDQVAAHDLCGGVVAERPEAWGEVLFGAFTCLYVEAVAGRAQLDRWDVASGAADGSWLASA